MKVKLRQQENVAGDKHVATQGFGRIVTERQPIYDPEEERDAAVSFFEENGFVVLNSCLASGEIEHLNEFYDRTQVEHPGRWGMGRGLRGPV